MKFIELLVWATKQIGNLSGDAAKTLFASRRITFSVAALFAVVAVGLSFWSLKRADYYQRTLETALTKNTENTPQTFKALESLILVAAETGPDGRQMPLKDSIERAPIANDFGRIIHNFDERFRDATAAPQKTTLKIAEPELTNGQVPSAQEAIITEANPADDLGFLFLPARLLHLHDDAFQNIRNDNAKLKTLVGIESRGESDVCVSPNSDLCDDVLLTRTLLRTMKMATNVAVTGAVTPGIIPTPAQVYIITENGLNRIVSAKGRDSSFYRNQFRATTVFPARPYYTGAFKKVVAPSTLLGDNQAAPQGLLGDYFYVSEPYLDIGGNGIVITLARAYRYPSHSEGALCFDLKLTVDDTLASKLSKFIGDLDGKSAELSCDMSRQADPQCGRTAGDATLARDISKPLQDMLQTARGNLNVAEVVGNFSFIRDKNETQGSPVSAGLYEVVANRLIHPKDEVRFILSTDPPLVTSVREQALQVHFLAASLNIGGYLQTTSIAGAIALSCFGIALTMVIGSWATETRISEAERREKELEQKERTELREALDNVSRVMLLASVPYVRLDNRDHIVDANPELAALLGFPPTQVTIDARLRHTRFEDWLADQQSVTEYHRVQKLRETGERVEPYQLTFRTVSGTVTKKVVSSVVPGSAKGSLPETFGILV